MADLLTKLLSGMRRITLGLLLGLAASSLALSGCGSSLARIDPELFPEPPRNSITFWGHACCYIDVNGFGIVTDPVFEKHLFFRTRKIPAPPPAVYAGTGVVLVSHAHDDHLSDATIRSFPESAIVLCPPPAAKYLEEVEQEVRVMGLGDTLLIPGGRIVAVAANHMAGRLGWRPNPDGRALGYVVETPTATIYYTGDTNFFPGFVEVSQKFRPDIALVSVSGHLHDTEAARAARQTGADVVIPVHHAAYGFLVVGERKRARSLDELQERLGSRLVTLELGESYPLPAAKRTTPPVTPPP